MELGKILFVTDGRQPKSLEIQRLMDFRSLGFEEVIILQATKVKGWERSLADFSMKSKVITVTGPLVSSILDAVRQEAVPLIAATVHRDTRGPFRRSLTRGLFRSSPVPVMILPEDVEASKPREKGLFDHVIFGTDWSTASDKALDYLLSFKEIIKELEILHVIDKRVSVREMRDVKEKLVQTRNIFLEHGIDAEPHIYAGRQSEEIMLAAKDYVATCIVMGTTGKSRLKDFLSQSCSYRVADASVVPTLVVP
jgi:nucleotide-binding universal stress UspA family protein